MKRGSARICTGQSLSTAMTPDLSGEVIRIDRASLDLYAIIISRTLVTFSDKIILLDVRDRFSMQPEHMTQGISDRIRNI